MRQTNPADTEARTENALRSRLEEAYLLLEKNSCFRIGVGVRADSPNASIFFVEIVLSLSSENAEVYLGRLEKVLGCLKKLQTRGYTLSYEDGNCVSCEKPVQDPNAEISAAKIILESLANSEA